MSIEEHRKRMLEAFEESYQIAQRLKGLSYLAKALSDDQKNSAFLSAVKLQPKISKSFVDENGKMNLQNISEGNNA